MDEDESTIQSPEVSQYEPFHTGSPNASTFVTGKISNTTNALNIIMADKPMEITLFIIFSPSLKKVFLNKKLLYITLDYHKVPNYLPLIL
jgi:hypothetical protein